MINKLKAWAIAHKQATIGICVAVAVVITISIGYAVVNHNAEPDNTASNQTQATSDATKSDENIKANPNVSDGTKDSVQSTSEQAKTETTTEPTPTAPSQPATQPSKPSDNSMPKSSGSSNTSGSSSKNNSSQSSQTPAPKSTRHWVDEKGHWENTTEQVWVPNVVTVVDTPATTKKVYDHSEYRFEYDGYTTTSESDCDAHAKTLLIAGHPSNYSGKDVYTTQTVPAVTHTEDHGHYETKVTGKKWVVDVAGHWED